MKILIPILVLFLLCSCSNTTSSDKTSRISHHEDIASKARQKGRDIAFSKPYSNSLEDMNNEYKRAEKHSDIANELKGYGIVDFLLSLIFDD